VRRRWSLHREHGADRHGHPRRHARHARCEHHEHHGGFGGFLRGLLSGLPWAERAEAEEVIEVAASPGGSLRIHSANGRIRVRGEERTGIEIRAHKVARAESREAASDLLREIRVIHGVVAGAIEIEVDLPRRWNRRGHVHLEARVPRDTSVEVSASNGKVCVENLRGAVRARSSNGSVDVAGVIGEIELSASNAKICCSGTQGHLVARSSNGKIELTDHRGSVDASTSNGLICASLDEVGRQGVQLATSNGRIALELPEKVDADVDIRVDNGAIRSERDLARSGPERGGRLRGRLGSGGTPVRLRTSNGSVSLR